MTEPAPAPASNLAPVPRWELYLVIGLLCAIYLPKLGSYTLWDPWEGHYAEVARRMLEEHDWLRMRWENENFHSKPPLTFWMMGFGMKALGVGADGGYSGEFVASARPEWAIRLPFALFGVFGVAFLWYALRRLTTRRAAWLAAAIVTTTPYYFFVTRQAITDMPSCALLISSLAIFLIVAHGDHDQPLRRWRWGVTQFHVFLAIFLVTVFWQLGYFAWNLQGLRYTVAPKTFIPGWLIMVPFAVGTLGLAVWAWFRTTTQRQVLMYWFYFMSGMAVLQKGPVAPGLAGLTILFYLILTGDWKLLAKVEIPRGVLIAVAICIPWHFAMYIKDGNPWLNEYLNQHLLNRALKGVHGDRGTFRYFFGQLGYGMFPWIAFVPVALARFAFMPRALSPRDKTRLIMGIWTVVGFFFFTMIATKFHHYVLPAVPAMAALVAFWLDDMLAGDDPRPALGLAVGLALLALTAADVVPQQQKLTQLFIYRYDRGIPRQAPWSIDYTMTLFWFALIFGATTIALFVRAARRYAVYAFCAAALAFTFFGMDVLMIRASPHYGQRSIFESYYQKRRINGVDLDYASPRDFADDWGKAADFPVDAFIPETLHAGDPARVGIRVFGEKVELHGQVSRLGHDRFFIAVPDGERARLGPLLERARVTAAGHGRRWVFVDAERLISKLYWRGEAYYAGGELWHSHWQEARSVFHELNDADNKQFQDYLKGREGQKLWVAAEKGHMAGIRGMLPTPKGKETFHEEDSSSSFFGLASFTL